MTLLQPTAFRDLDHRLHQEILAYSAYAEPTFAEVHIRKKVFRFIDNGVKSSIPGSRVGIFGSVVTGLTIPVPDLDLAIITEDMTKTDVKRQLFRLRDRFRRGRLIDGAEVRFHAKVPIVRFTTRPEYGSMSVDIGVNNTDGMHVAEMIKDYREKMPELRPLVLVMKGLLARSGFNDPARGGLGSYPLVCMCISFLQVNPPLESLGKLLTGMLYYYGVSFPYETSYISVREGQVLLKSTATWCETEDKLVVQCLTNPKSNIASSVDGTAKLRKIFKEAYVKLSEVTIDDPLVLGTIVGYPQRVLDHRAAIKALVDARPPAIRMPGLHRDSLPRSNGGRTNESRGSQGRSDSASSSGHRRRYTKNVKS
ncbi:Nucleotidyltransferase [Guyanagaster necrorhizus]|uniref:polynucleotide adenylyltransferase n=1 Tax=Guyanagaster necrorhizus TaxID=856835 RepID=A0A9P7W4F5_9AGAR|nr:Nucleotidyltransferase [Guyanagaster necrorhizus MCA 3950]KAG7451934.1 Nucleotidyltransferase [Guyanagaster necrorhizus MCA 3950]